LLGFDAVNPASIELCSECVAIGRLHDLHLAANPAFAVDHLPALFGLHPGAKTDLAGALNIARFVGIMHVWLLKRRGLKGCRSLTFSRMSANIDGKTADNFGGFL